MEVGKKTFEVSKFVVLPMFFTWTIWPSFRPI